MPGPACPPWQWCHIAVTVDLTSYPAYDINTYMNGQFLLRGTGTFTSGLNPSVLEEDTFSLVLGQDQDSQLGGFDPTQIFSGHMDEVRMWNTIRTPQEILSNYNLILTAPYPSSLVSYYTFDEAAFDARYFEDKANSSSRRRLFMVDYSNATTSPTPPPAYAPAPVTLPALAVSTAPVCAAPAAGSWRLVRVAPDGTVAVPVSALYCGASGPVKATVTAVSGGTVAGLGTALGSSQTITFVAASGAIVPGAGFNFTVTDGTATTAGFVGVLPNAAPAIAGQLAISGDEDTVVTAWVPVMDPDRDIVAVTVAVAPTAGVLSMDGLVNRSLRYTPPANANGMNVGQFALVARDTWGAASSTMQVSVSLRPVPDPPMLIMSTNFTIYRGQRLTIPFQVVDVDGLDPFIIVSDWPGASQGYLEAQDKGETWTVNEASVSSKVQWATGFGNWSTMYAPTPFEPYGIGQIIGTPTTTEYGDSYNSWCPSTPDGGCVNRAGFSDGLSVFYTEFIEATYATPMYLSEVVLVQNYGGDRVSRILVPSDRDPSKWKPVLTRDLSSLPASPSAFKWSVESPSICNVPWPINKVRVEFDTCHRTGWYELDAIQIRGGVVPSQNVLNATAQLAFQAAAGYTGTVVFGLTATQCIGSFDDTAAPLSITVVVEDTPCVLTTSVHDGWASIDVGTLGCGPRVGNVMALELPEHGTLSYGGQALNDTLQDLGSPTTVFQYEAYRCDATLTDTFLVQLGPMAVVQVNVQGCTTAMSLLIPIVVPCVVGPLALSLLGILWWRHSHGQRDNSRAPKDPNQNICVLFTDIQASTLLWGEVPEMMSTALDAHHALIRQLIKKYKCYEVKTIGDSFMVATTDPGAAVHLALAIQEALYDHNWDRKGLDEVYRRQTDCYLPPDVYGCVWRGLRVRVGVHFGRAQITFDETTKGYDYYGTVVNTAARIESAAHGGQVLLSREMYSCVAETLPDLGVSARSLGVVQLRGLKSPLELVLVLPARFATREFPPLRLDHGPDGEEEEGQGDVETTSELRDRPTTQYPQALEREVLTHPMVRCGALSSEAAASLSYNVFYTVKSLLNMCKKPEERKKRLEEYCKQWHVPCTVSSAKKENASLGRLSLQLLGSVANQLHSPHEFRKVSAAESVAGLWPPPNRVAPSASNNNSPALSPAPSPRSDAQRLSLFVDK
eukprot:EG_transcript_360